MYMSENVQSWFQPRYRFQKLWTSTVTSITRRAVKGPEGRPVRHQDIDVLWNAGIKLASVLLRTTPEGPSIERGHGGSPDFQAQNLYAFLYEDRGIRNHSALVRIDFQEKFVIARHDNLDLVRQFPEPIVEIPYSSDALAEHSEIASVDEDVSIRHVKLPMKLVGVRDAGNSYVFHQFRQKLE